MQSTACMYSAAGDPGTTPTKPAPLCEMCSAVFPAPSRIKPKMRQNIELFVAGLTAADLATLMLPKDVQHADMKIGGCVPGSACMELCDGVRVWLASRAGCSRRPSATELASVAGAAVLIIAPSCRLLGAASCCRVYNCGTDMPQCKTLGPGICTKTLEKCKIGRH